MTTKRATPRRGRPDPTEADKLLREKIAHAATRLSLVGSQGGYVTDITLRGSGQVFLIRRISLQYYMGAEKWPIPITKTVRQMMLVGNAPTAWGLDDLGQYERAAIMLARAACIVPPKEWLDGTVSTEEITPDMCRPLFVDLEAEPDEDQAILCNDGERLDGLAQITYVRAELKKASAADKPELERMLVLAENRASAMVVLHFGDLANLAGEVIDNGPGSLARFRPESEVVVGGME